MTDAPTILEALLEQLRLREQYNSNEEVAPAAILWPDPERQWEALAPRLRQLLPHFLTLGPYDKANRTGPAIWAKCMLGRTLPEVTWAEETIPIVYLPGVSRRDLRPTDDCPRHLQPLCELQYRGVIWSQISHRDWTILAFLKTEDGGLGLDVATDEATKEAMRRALLVLADQNVASLRGKRLDQAYFDGLLNPDEVAQLLRWLSNPQAHREACDDNCWEAFRHSCGRYGFDPETDGFIPAAEKLGSRQPPWDTVWGRFAEAPTNYPGIPEQLRRARPTALDSLFADESTWPQDNEQKEDQLRAQFLALEGAGPEAARKTIVELERTHGERRRWVWAKLGQAPLAQALGHLAALAHATATPLGGQTPQAMAESYVAGKWQADAEVLASLAAVAQQNDVMAVQTAIRAVYVTWLEQSTIAFQTLVSQHGLLAGEAPEAKPGCCLLFADGLRYDVAQRLSESLEKAGLEHEVTWQFTALPSVTATTKPAVSPVVDKLTGADQGTDFTPCLRTDGKPLTTERFRKLLGDQGIAYLSGQETGDPSETAWTEHGALDRKGHDEQSKVAWRIEEEIRGLLERVRSLVTAGWREVHVVTDHGWLLVPGALPKLDLPQFLTETRWGRCAELKATSQVTILTAPWRWNPAVSIAMAPGISCFVRGSEYAHGGVSLQECVVPVLTVTATRPAAAVTTIAEVKWTGLRCRVQVEGGAGLLFDLRTKAADAGSSATSAGQPVTVAENGVVTVLVDQDDREGQAAIAVVLDERGQVQAQQQTIIGGQETAHGNGPPRHDCGAGL
jgi:hypothetical protein